jgi:hypothetical protein
MRIGVVGSGVVGETLANGFLKGFRRNDWVHAFKLLRP